MKYTKEEIDKTIIKYNGNQSEAARQLGISRNTLRKYMCPRFVKKHYTFVFDSDTGTMTYWHK